MFLARHTSGLATKLSRYLALLIGSESRHLIFFSVYIPPPLVCARLIVYAVGSHDDSVVWFENIGGQPPTFTTHVVYSNAAWAMRIVHTDADGDGDLDCQ